MSYFRNARRKRLGQSDDVPRHKATCFWTAIFLIVNLCVAHWACAAPNPSTSNPASSPAATAVTVGLYITPPFVMSTPNGYSGMAIELWEDIAQKTNLTYKYQLFKTFPDLLRAVSNAQVDVAVADITITKERLESMDFSQPWFDSGLRIMISAGRASGFRGVLDALGSRGHLQVYIILGVFLILFSFVITLLSRRFERGFPKEWHVGFIDGFYQACAWIVGRATANPPFGLLGRFLTAISMICGTAVVAFVTSSITSTMTVSALRYEINGVSDLIGKTVGARAGTVGAEYCINVGLSTRTFVSMQDSVNALLRNQIAAIVDDASELEYYKNSHHGASVVIVGSMFKPEKYAFATPIGSGLSRKINLAILDESEDGRLAQLNEKYFGTTP